MSRRELMTARDAALAAGNVSRFQALTVEIAKLPVTGVPAPTAKSIARYVGGAR